MKDNNNEVTTLLNNLISNPLAFMACIILGVGILFTFASRQFILVRVLLGDVSFIKQRITGIVFVIVGAVLLLFATGNLNF